MNVCIIGAGTAGLCSARRALENNFTPIVFEQNEEIGGTWVYTEEVGINSYGIEVHSSMYSGLRTNLPKEIMGFPDFPITKSDKSYVESEVIRDYLNEYADKFKLKDCIQFLHCVIRVQPKGDKWHVLVKDLKRNIYKTYTFDFILVCNGHYHTPMYPAIKNMNLFKGEQMHSHDFRNEIHFQDKSVLVIGGGPSGMDLCHKISKAAARVTLSHHIPDPMNTQFTSNVYIKPDVEEFTQHGAIFTDGSEQNFDSVLYCTGFKYSFPFLSIDCEIFVDDNYVQPLYKHCINIHYPTMAFIGLPFYVCAAQMMDLQVRFVMKHFTKEIDMPNKEFMQNESTKEMQKRWEKGYKKRQAHMMGPDQIYYYDDLATTAGIYTIKPVMTYLHNEASQRFLDDLIHFREDNFKIVDDEKFVKVN